MADPIALERARLELELHRVKGSQLQIELRRLEIAEEMSRLDHSEEAIKRTVIEIEGKLTQLQGEK